MANITAHMLLSGDGEKKVDDPTNDPRPLFRHTRTNNSVTNPPFTRKAKSDKRTLGQNKATRTPPSVRPHPGRHGAPPRSDKHWSKRQTGRPDVHKAPRRSQLSKHGTGGLGPNDPTRTNALTWGDTTRPLERTHMGANGKRAARTCTRHPGSHNLANLTRAPSDQTARPGRTPSPDTTKRPNSNERPHRGQHDAPTRTDAHEQTTNGPPGRAQGTRAVTT